MKKIILFILLLTLASCNDIISALQGYQANRPPVISGVTSSIDEGTPIVPDMQIDLTVAAKDPENETITYSFLSDDGSIKNLTNTDDGCTLQFFTGDSIQPGAKVILKITATDARGAVSSVEYDVGTGKMGPTVSVSGEFPSTIEMDGSISGTLSADSDGFYQIRIIDDVNEEISFDENEASYFYHKDTEKEFKIYGPGFSNEFTPQLLIPEKSPDKVAIIVKDTLGLEGYAEFTVSVNPAPVVELDNENPTVSITQPLYDGNVQGLTPIKASAFDNTGIDRVEFYINGTLAQSDESAPYEVSYDFAASAASYTVEARAFDMSENSASHSITVNYSGDIEAPYVGLISPSNGDKLYGVTAITAQASDNETVTKVEFYISDSLIYTDYTSPYTIDYNFQNAGIGHHTIKAVAYDNNGNTSFHFYPDITVLELPLRFGQGEDGDITILSGYTVSVKDLYNNENVPGVITKYGDGKGLKHAVIDPADTYDPKNGRYIKAGKFTIQNTAVLTSEAWDDGSDDSNGIIWIASTGNFENQGTIDMNGKGGAGGAGGVGDYGSGTNGIGNGAGFGGAPGNNSSGGNKGAGSSYGSAVIDTTNWGDIYGSGGGGGGGTGYSGSWWGGWGGGGAGNAFPGNNNDSSHTTGSKTGGGYGGKGGGSVRIFTVQYISNNGKTEANGLSGQTAHSGGGGGSGGTIFIESLENVTIGVDLIFVSGGAGGLSTYGSNGGDGSVGRIAISVPDGVTITGQTTPNYYNIRDGVYHTP